MPIGSRGPKTKPPETQTLADAVAKPKTDAPESLVLITLPTTANFTQVTTQNLVSSVPDLSKLKIKSPVNVDPPVFLNLETLALSEDQAAKSTVEGGEGAEQARLFGIYTVKFKRALIVSGGGPELRLMKTNLPRLQMPATPSNARPKLFKTQQETSRKFCCLGATAPPPGSARWFWRYNNHRLYQHRRAPRSSRNRLVCNS